jgi:hypothetical protein
VTPFDLTAFQAAAEDEIRKMRTGANYLDRLSLTEFKQENSWETTQRKFLAAMEKLKVASGAAP